MSRYLLVRTVCIAATIGVSLAVRVPPERRPRSQPARRVVTTGVRTVVRPAVGLSKDTTDVLPAVRIARAKEAAEYERRVSGLRVNLSSRLDEKTRRAHAQIAAVLEQANFVPPARVTHFQWIVARKLPIKGWTGEIKRVTPTPAGVNVAIHVWPFSGSGLQNADHVLEEYLVTENQAVFLGMQPACAEEARYPTAIN